jgi:hypothetical protein
MNVASPSEVCAKLMIVPVLLISQQNEATNVPPSDEKRIVIDPRPPRASSISPDQERLLIETASGAVAGTLALFWVCAVAIDDPHALTTNAAVTVRMRWFIFIRGAILGGLRVTAGR